MKAPKEKKKKNGFKIAFIVSIVVNVLLLWLVVGAMISQNELSADNDTLQAKVKKLEVAQAYGKYQQTAKKARKAIDDLDEAASFKPKTLSTAGMVQYTITGITEEKVENDESNYSDAEYNFSGISDFPSEYYRTEISYTLKNVGSQSLDLSTYSATILDSNNVEYGRESNDDYGIDINSNGDVNPNTATKGTFYLLSKTKIDISHFSINVGDQWGGPNDDRVANGGVVKYE